MQQKVGPLAFALALLAAAAVPTIGVAVVLAFFMGEEGWWSWFWLTVGITFGVALLHLAFLGVPAVWWLRATQRYKAWTMALAGAVVAMIPISLLTLPIAPWADASDTWDDWAQLMAVFAPVGAVSAVVFYLVTRGMAKAAPAPATATT